MRATNPCEPQRSRREQRGRAKPGRRGGLTGTAKPGSRREAQRKAKGRREARGKPKAREAQGEPRNPREAAGSNQGKAPAPDPSLAGSWIRSLILAFRVPGIDHRSHPTSFLSISDPGRHRPPILHFGIWGPGPVHTHALGATFSDIMWAKH